MEKKERGLLEKCRIRRSPTSSSPLSQELASVGSQVSGYSPPTLTPTPPDLDSGDVTTNGKYALPPYVSPSF